MFKKTILIFLVISIIIMTTGIVMADWRDYDRDPDPEVLTYSIIATEEVALHVNRYQGFLDYISEVTGKDTEWYITTSYASQIEAMRTGLIDIANFGPTSAVLAMDESGAEVYGIRVDKSTGVQGYYTYVTALADSGIEKFPEDAKDKLMAFTDPASTSGHVAVRYHLEEELGIVPEDYFDDIIWTGSHQASQLGVKEGRVDVGACASTVYHRMVDRDEIDPDEVVIVWQSDVIPLGPFTYRTDLNEELKKQIREAAYNFHNTEYATIWLDEMNTTGIEPASNEDFKMVRGMMKILED